MNNVSLGQHQYYFWVMQSQIEHSMRNMDPNVYRSQKNYINYTKKVHNKV